jgi:hypothetical protein
MTAFMEAVDNALFDGVNSQYVEYQGMMRAIFSLHFQSSHLG